jgi:hypothetical protein
MSRHAAVSTLLRWKENPVAFVRQCLGVEHTGSIGPLRFPHGRRRAGHIGGKVGETSSRHEPTGGGKDRDVRRG